MPTRVLRDVLDEGNPNKVDTAVQQVLLGSALALIKRFVLGTVTSHVMVLPNNAKAQAVISAFSRAGTLTGRLTPVRQGTSVTTGLVGINAVGDILFATADAVTSAEVTYLSVEGEVVTETVPVTAAGVALLSASRTAVGLISATLVTGSVTGAKTVLARGATPATTEVAVTVLNAIQFLAADVGSGGGTATVTYIATPSVGTTTPASLANRLETTAVL